ncbi:MAG: hypothetical protein JWL90_2591 [Chthoniobacteraceae bacterium]|nr:hypothetical protein [Chthoniobacteraceae bacterium]
MNDHDSRKYKSLLRVQIFCEQRRDGFAPDSIAARNFLEVDHAIEEALKAEKDQKAGGNMIAGGSDVKSLLYETLYDDVALIALTARSLEEEMPGFAADYPMPSGNSFDSLLLAARNMKDKAAPKVVQARFMAYEMPRDFHEALSKNIEALEQANVGKEAGLDKQVGATERLKLALRRGMTAVRHINAAVQNKFRYDSETLRAWKVASHIERAPRRAKKAKEIALPILLPASAAQV